MCVQLSSYKKTVPGTARAGYRGLEDEHPRESIRLRFNHDLNPCGRTSRDQAGQERRDTCATIR